MKIRWNETFEVEIIDQYDEELDNIGESHNETLKAGTIADVDIIDRDGETDYVDIQFDNGSLISGVHSSTFTEIDERTSTPEDCEKCDEDDCDVSHCIISD